MISVGKVDLPWREGITVADLLRELDDTKRYPAARVNGETVLNADFHKTIIPDGSKIYLIPMMAGG